eukprot:scpid71699/ scgid30872/ 
MADPSRDARKLSAPSSGEAQRTPSPGTVHRNQPAPGASAVEVLVSSPPTVSQTDPSSARAAEASSSSPFYAVRPVVASSTPGTSTHSASTTNSTIGVSSFDHRRTRSMPESGTPRIAQLDDFRLDSATEEECVELESGLRDHATRTSSSADHQVTGGGGGSSSGGGTESEASGTGEQSLARPSQFLSNAAAHWVTVEGINILNLAKEYLFQATSIYGYSQGDIHSAGLGVDTSSRTQVPTERKIAARLTELTRELEQGGKISPLIDALRNTAINYNTFNKIAGAFVDSFGLSWTSVYVIFVLAQNLVRIMMGKKESASRVILWLGRFILDRLLSWILEIGGGFLSLITEPLSAQSVLKAGVVFALLAGGFYYLSGD